MLISGFGSTMQCIYGSQYVFFCILYGSVEKQLMLCYSHAKVVHASCHRIVVCDV